MNQIVEVFSNWIGPWAKGRGMELVLVVDGRGGYIYAKHPSVKAYLIATSDGITVSKVRDTLNCGYDDPDSCDLVKEALRDSLHVMVNRYKLAHDGKTASTIAEGVAARPAVLTAQLSDPDSPVALGIGLELEIGYGITWSIVGTNLHGGPGTHQLDLPVGDYEIEVDS